MRDAHGIDQEVTVSVEPTTSPRSPVPQRMSRARRLAPVLALLLLAPWAAECSWGGFTALGSLAVVFVLAPLYGGAAVLVRETARRTGGGWPSIILLAAAFGWYMAGLVDQSLFNPDFLSDTEYAELSEAAADTRVPGLGFSAEQAVDFVGNHIALTICAPIAIVESLVGPARRRQPWLGRWGLLVVGLLLLLGSLMIFTDDESGRQGFLLGPAQFAGTVLVIAALVAVALLPRWRRGTTTRLTAAHPTVGRLDAPAPTPDRTAPPPVLVAAVVLAASLGAAPLSGWVRVAVQLTAAAVVGTLIVAWSRRRGWGQRHVLAAWSAVLVNAAAFAYLVPSYAPAGPTEALVGDLTVTAVTVTLLTAAVLRLRHP
ncbi:hypothetical protein ACFOOK_23525 [Micromonospora krabiensis]|uniref:Uncharacterized protein n=1 Tax=Micromonospora krabiensis TaxID=307121 RepID=A0A1C3N796_9ACTN|nr:hypothetical protein [Micromonospora krabiensis]SBV28464.1 hypothetical protein GA0070620_4007 [Micromonospora krabiensis]